MADAADSPEADATADPKAAFKAALDRKRGQQAARNEAGGPTGGGKIHGEHSAAGGKRTFRRKSGG